MEFIKDDMLFKPYLYGGYQCKIKIRAGTISVRYKGGRINCRQRKTV